MTYLNHILDIWSDKSALWAMYERLRATWLAMPKGNSLRRYYRELTQTVCKRLQILAG